MAIHRESNLYVVTVRGRGPARLVDTAATRDQARDLETAMIAALHDTGTWPAKRPAKGTLAAVLRDAWSRPDGWHTMKTGAALYAHAVEFVAFMGADRMAEEITEEGLASYLVGKAQVPYAARSVLQLLQTASDSGAASWRPVRRKGRSHGSPIALLQERHTTSSKIVPAKSSGNRRDGVLWEMVEVKGSKWA
ncbi:MAG: hypothetical protein ACK43M_02435 [Allorhizobium sp.]